MKLRLKMQVYRYLTLKFKKENNQTQLLTGNPLTHTTYRPDQPTTYKPITQTINQAPKNDSTTLPTP